MLHNCMTKNVFVLLVSDVWKSIYNFFISFVSSNVGTVRAPFFGGRGGEAQDELRSLRGWSKSGVWVKQEWE